MTLRRHRCLALIGLAAATALTGCSQFSPQTTTNVTYPPSDGVQATSGTFGARNVLVVTDGDGGPATLLGTLVNHGDADVSAAVASPAGLDGTINVPAGSQVQLGQGEDVVMVDEAGEMIMPGRLVEVSIQAGTQALTLQVPVLDGTLPEYADVMPTATPQSPTASG